MLRRKRKIGDMGSMIGGTRAQKMPTRATSWDTIPADVLAEVLRKLQPSDVKSIGSIYLTCRGWRDCIRMRQQTLKPKLLHHLLATSFPNVQSLDLRKCKYHPDQLAVLTQQNGLKHLALQLSSTQDAVHQLSELPSISLTSLKLSGESVHWTLFEALQQLTKCTTLRELDLKDCMFERLHASSLNEVLQGLTQLERLSLQAAFPWQAVDETCETLSRMPSLTHLEMRQPLGILPTGLKSLAKLERLQSLCLGPCLAGPESTAAALSYATQLTCLELCFSTEKHVKEPVLPEAFEHIAKLPRLKVLQLSGFEMSCVDDLPSLKGLSALTHLRLRQVPQGSQKKRDYFHNILCSIPMHHLIRLELSETPICGRDLHLLKQATGLLHLDISHCWNLQGSDLCHLSCLSRLESLNLDGTFGSDKLTPSWSFLQHVTGLTELCWAAPSINNVFPRTDDVGLISLGACAASLTKLQRLVLRGHCLERELVGVTTLTSLTELDISSPSGSEACANSFEYLEGLMGLGRLTKMQRLNLARTHVTSAALSYIALGMQELLHLDLSGTAVGDNDLIALRMLPRLQSLFINDQPALDDIGDGGLRELARLPALRCLEVRSNARITAAGLRHLSALTGLSDLDVSDCFCISPKKALKNLQGRTTLRTLRLGSAGSVCHADPCKEPSRVPTSAVAAFRARMPFLHALTLAPHHVMQENPSKAVVAAAVVGVEDCIVWLILTWLSICGNFQALLQGLGVSTRDIAPRAVPQYRN
ncbi:probable adenylate cyclase regulatory protein at N-terminal half [Coccomyxa sp. Obi]|nr:probable adenylate cyclase regulatory protein at N-terminal half [Coccomyxa sp. Obi]